MASDPDIPCVVYAVKSSPDDKDAISTQVEACRDAITRLGGRRLAHEPFTEDNASGSRRNRGPRLAAALAAVKTAAKDGGAAKYSEDLPAGCVTARSARCRRGVGSADLRPTGCAA